MIALAGYQITAKIYESRHSLIYRGQRLADQQPIVLKAPLTEDLTPQQRLQFHNEAECTRQLTIPGIRRVLETVRFENQEALILEYVAGETLKQAFVEQRRSLPEILAAAIELARILGAMHRQQMIHRDVNPSNILVTPTNESEGGTWRITLIDFGMAARISVKMPQADNPEQLEGTLAYISPEQTGRMNRAVDERTDLYALGVTLYEILTGRLPFEAEDALEMVHAHLAKAPPPPQEINPAIPDLLARIVLKLLAKNAADRYQSAVGLQSDLERCLANLTGRQDVSDFELAQRDFSGRFQLPQKLYGREPEIAQILQAFERICQEPQRALLLVAGAAGVGKSALAYEVDQPVTAQRGCFLQGKFDQFQRDIPYFAIVQVVEGLVTALLTKGEAELQAWRDAIQQAVGNIGQVLLDVFPALELILGPQPDAPELDGLAAQNRFHYAMQRLVSALAQTDSPLVLFIDDWQWADWPSIHLLEILLTDETIQHFLVIAAYRENEVTPTHPLLRCVAQIKTTATDVQTIHLSNLTFDHVRALLADALPGADMAGLADLAGLVYAKTQGNAFFVRQFLSALAEEELLAFDFERLAWRWDLEQIRAKDMTDNVATLLTQKVRKLPAAARQILPLAACMGHRFELAQVSMIAEKDLAATQRDLEPAVWEGLLLPNHVRLPQVDPAALEYRFAHDRIQQAAYALLAEEEQQAVHLRIGRLLLAKFQASDKFELLTSTPELEAEVFEIANHWNKGLALLTEPAERMTLARLNLLAGQKASASAAYQPALAYFRTGLRVLAPENWQTDYAFTLALHLSAAKAAYLSGDFAQAEQLIQAAGQQAQTLLDRVALAEVRIQVQVAQNNFPQAIAIGLAALRELGLRLPLKPGKLRLLATLVQTKFSLRRQRLAALYELPAMDRPERIAAMRILTNINGPAHFASPNLSPLLALTTVTLSLQAGHTAQSPFAYVYCGLMLHNVFGDLETAYQLGKLAVKLSEQARYQEGQARTLMIFNVLIRHWQEPVRESIAACLTAYHLGIASGDVEYAASAASLYLSLLTLTGTTLAEVEAQTALYHGIVAQLNQEKALDAVNLSRQFVLNLRGYVEIPTQLSGLAYDEAVMLPRYLERGDHAALARLYLAKLILSYMFQEYPSARKHARQTETYIQALKGTPHWPRFYFYDALAHLAGDPTGSAWQRLSWRRRVRRIQRRLKKWARQAPRNYLHRFYLVAAEWRRVRGQDGPAGDYYDRAIALAKEQRYLHDEALACELAGRFYLTRNRSELAHYYLRQAQRAYQEWGAAAKVKQLAEQYPQLRPLSTDRSAARPDWLSSSDRTALQQLDLHSILKASQSLSGEIAFARLLQNLIHAIIENAGAEKGYLMLPRGGDWLIVAEGQVGAAPVTLQTVPMAESGRIALGLVNYVMRSHRSVVLHDAAQEGPFTRDAYILAQRPKSICCLPLMRQGKLSGLAYLENNLTTGAFTPDRLAVLTLLASQAAISLENADLYATQEQKVAERTRELTAANQQSALARQQADAANRAKSVFLTSLSHELRTPLNGILGYAQLLQRDLALTPPQHERVQAIRQSGQHLLNLINDILDFAKIEAGKVELNLTEVPLPALLRSLGALIRLRAEAKALAFRVEIAPTLPQIIYADELRLRQVLLNLLENAVKFTEQGAVSLRVVELHEFHEFYEFHEFHELKNSPTHELSNSPTHELSNSPTHELRFEVADTGVGIAAEDAAAIFEPFQQVGADKYKAQGTGLGLAISRNLIQAMGSELHVTSEPGRGSTFWFVLTARSVRPGFVSTQADARQIIGVQGPPPRIVVVDDNPVNRRVIVDVLTPLGFAIREASNGREGWQTCLDVHPQALITGLRLPELDGLALIRQLRQTTAFKDLVIIVSSASVSADDRQQSIAAGSHAFLPKPIDVDQLLDQLQRWLRLTWRYRETRADAASQERPAELILPPVPSLQALAAFAQIGDITGLRQALTALAQTDVRFLPFTTRLQCLAREFQIEKIWKILEDSLT